MITKIAGSEQITSAAVDLEGQILCVGKTDGTIAKVRLDGTEEILHQAGQPVVSLALMEDTIAVALANGSVWLYPIAAADGASEQIMNLGSGVGQLAASKRRSTVTVVDLDPARKLAIHRANRPLKEIAIDGLAGVAIAERIPFVCYRLAGAGTVGRLKGSQPIELASGLPEAGRIGFEWEAGKLASLIIAHETMGQASRLDLTSGTLETLSTNGVDGRIYEIHGLWDGRLLIVSETGLHIADKFTDLVAAPAIVPPPGPVFVGSWAPIGIGLHGTALTLNDVEARVPGGPNVGIISMARESGASEPSPIFVAAGTPGSHKLELIKKSDGSTLATAEVKVTDHWPDADEGPPGFYGGTWEFYGDSGWGGGPGTPQNVSTKPHNGAWRALVLMVDTATARWPMTGTTIAQNQTDILAHVDTGFAFSGANRSARMYYEENSNWRPGSGATPDRGVLLSVHNGQVFGPLNLPDNWGDYFEQDADKKWWSKGGTLQTIVISAVNAGIVTRNDFFACDLIIVVPCSPDGAGGDRFVWPHANEPRVLLCGTDLLFDWHFLAFTFVPLDFAVHDGRQMHTTLSHELGHTLGLPDLYDLEKVFSAAVKARLTGGWDMMAGSTDTLPHFSLSNKMRMGWVDPAQLQLFNFQGSGAVNQTITLHAAELGDAPAGRVRGIEIRLANGWNYYVEYRAEQAGLISDDLITDRQVVITDVTSDNYVTPISRPPIMFVADDIDGDGPLIGTGDDMEEKDPGTQLDLKVEVISTAVDNAVVRVTYGSNGRPEPGIRPWSAGPDWQSPDIEVRNDKTDADPGQYLNTPWVGHPNRVVAKVTNAGDILATGVVVDFFVTEFTTGDGPWTNLGSVTQDVGPGSAVEFEAEWNPPADEDRHYCIIVRIRLYQDPANPLVVDNNIYNNEARSNYTEFISSSASPSTRVGARVALANPFDSSTLVFADVKKTHAQHRVYTSHQWRRVEGQSQADIQVWDEAMYGTPEWPAVASPNEERQPVSLWRIPNKVSISGWARKPFPADCGALTLTGGVGLKVSAGRETAVKLLRTGRGYVSGEVAYVDTGGPVNAGGKVLIVVLDKAGLRSTATVNLHQGSFSAEFHMPSADPCTLTAYYLGAVGAAASQSEPAKI